MNLLISSNYNLSEEKWSIVIKYNNNIKAITLERIARIKLFPNETFFGQKNYYKLFINGLNSLLDGIDFCDLKNIHVINFPFKLESLFENKDIYYYELREHHLLHAYSAFSPSTFKKSAILIIDGAGYDEKYNKELCYSIWHYDDKKIKNLFSGEIKKDKFKLGVGYMYALHTLLFKMGEGSIMGLSSFGNPEKYKDIDLFGDDFLLKDKYVKIFEKYKNFGGNMDDLLKIIQEIYGVDIIDLKTENLIKTKFKDIASRLQHCTENTIINLAYEAKKLSKSDNLCIAGGVGLNIIANTLILEKNIFNDIFVQPACDDSGLSLGGIYYLENIILKNKPTELKSYGLGQEFSNEEIQEKLNSYKGLLNYEFNNDIYKETSKLLENKNIVGWFQGGSELGPRALGFRSILARPDSLKIRNRINKIKNREYWRPLAPVILEEELCNYFNTDFISPFMLFNGKIKASKFSKILGTSHTDGSARYQTVNKENNLYLYHLLKEFDKKTDIPVLINTSFNNHEEPIIETPDEAIKMFLSSDLDYLVIGNFVVQKSQKLSEYTFNKDKEYLSFFNNNEQVFERIAEILFNGLKTKYKIRANIGKIEYCFNNSIIEISFIENNVIGYRKNILLTFVSKINDEIKNIVINNSKLNKNKIYKLLSIYYKDFINDRKTEIIVSENNFIL